MKRLDNSPFGIISILCLLLAVDCYSSAVAFLAFLTKNLSNVSCLYLRCKIFMICIIASSLKMCTALFAIVVSG